MGGNTSHHGEDPVSALACNGDDTSGSGMSNSSDTSGASGNSSNPDQCSALALKDTPPLITHSLEAFDNDPLMMKLSPSLINSQRGSIAVI